MCWNINHEAGIISRLKPFIRASEDMRAKAPPPIHHGQWDSTLTRIAQHADSSAYTALFHYFAPRFYIFALKTLGNEQLAMLMVQRTMLAIWQQAYLFDAKQHCATSWIFHIARNIRFDLMQQSRVKGNSNINDINANDIWQEDIQVEPSDISSPFIEQHIDKKLAANFAILPITQQLIMHKVSFEKKSLAAISTELDLPLGTVTARFRLALTRLKEAVDGSKY